MFTYLKLDNETSDMHIYKNLWATKPLPFWIKTIYNEASHWTVYFWRVANKEQAALDYQLAWSETKKKKKRWYMGTSWKSSDGHWIVHTHCQQQWDWAAFEDQQCNRPNILLALFSRGWYIVLEDVSYLLWWWISALLCLWGRPKTSITPLCVPEHRGTIYISKLRRICEKVPAQTQRTRYSLILLSHRTALFGQHHFKQLRKKSKWEYPHRSTRQVLGVSPQDQGYCPGPWSYPPGPRGTPWAPGVHTS